MLRLKVGQQDLFEKKLSQDAEVRIVSESPIMKKLLEKVKKVSQISAPVLILGAASSGKKTIANEIFERSIKNNKELVVFNSSGINSNLMDLRFFGSKKNKVKGCLDDIEGKTLLIQNVDLLSLDVQLKLLNFFQNFNNLKPKNSYNFCVICTANELISQKVEKGEFREDLFRYLSQTLLIIPSLVEREQDIPSLVNIFLENNGFTGVIDKGAMERLKAHSWKGNLIELKNVCFQIASLSNYQVVMEEHLPIFSSKDLDLALFVKYSPKIRLEDLVNYYISQSLKHFKSKKESAKSLSISVKTIYNKIEQGVIQAG